MRTNMQYHPLTEKLWERGTGTKEAKELDDKIIRDWLREKRDDFFNVLSEKLLTNKRFNEKFDLTKQSCECGACNVSDGVWFWCRNKMSMYVISYCPNCGSKLGDL